MPLMPKRVKLRKSQRGKIKGNASRGNTVSFGEYGLQSLEGGWLSAEAIEAGRITATHSVRGEGRLYMVEDIGALPKIFMKETQEAQKSQLVEDLIHVRVAKKVEAIEGTNVENAPPLHGYVLTTAKPRASTVLRVPPDKEAPDQLDPLLATWRFGLGTTAAWTSDLGGAWAQDNPTDTSSGSAGPGASMSNAPSAEID